MAVAAGLIAAGIAMKAYGTYKSSQAEASLLREKASLLDLSANRILDLNTQNTENTIRNMRTTQGSAVNQMVASGFASETDVLSEIAMAASREIKINTEEANFRATQARLEATQKRKAAKATAKAGKISAISGGILDTASAFGGGK